MTRTREEIIAMDTRALERRARRTALPVVGPCTCCHTGQVRQWPTGALECDNPYCTIMGADLSEFTEERKPHMLVDVLQLTQEEIANLYRA